MNNSQWRPGKRVAIVGGGPGGVSAALGFISRGYDVRIYERRSDCKPIGGGVLLATPVLAILRSYGVNIDNFGLPTTTWFRNQQGHERAEIPFNHEVEKRMGIKGWHYGMLRSGGFARFSSVFLKASFDQITISSLIKNCTRKMKSRSNSKVDTHAGLISLSLQMASDPELHARPLATHNFSTPVFAFILLGAISCQISRQRAEPCIILRNTKLHSFLCFTMVKQATSGG